MTPGTRVRYTLPQCAPQEGVGLQVLAKGQTLAVLPEGHPPSLPPFWVAANRCEKVQDD